MCTVAFIVSLLGYMPPPGTVVTVPKSIEQSYPAAVRWQALRCARKYKIIVRSEGK